MCVQWVLAYVFGCSYLLVVLSDQVPWACAQTVCKPCGLREYAAVVQHFNGDLLVARENFVTHGSVHA